jgi:ABC-type nickel/cobalt efflux system permease component RcnA
MYRILNLGLLACLAGLALMLMNHQSELFVSLIVAPAIGLIGCALLIIVALASIVRPAREFNGAVSNEGSEA